MKIYIYDYDTKNQLVRYSIEFYENFNSVRKRDLENYVKEIEILLPHIF